MGQARRGGPQPAPPPAGDHPERRRRVSGVPPRPRSAGQAYGRTPDPQTTPPPPKDQRDHRGRQRNWGDSCWANFGPQTFGSQTPPPSSANVSLSACQGLPGGRAALRDAWDVTLARPRAGGLTDGAGGGGGGLISAPRAGPIPDGHASVHGGGGGGLHAGCGLVWQTPGGGGGGGQRNSLCT